jgi:hypothetical protein
METKKPLRTIEKQKWSLARIPSEVETSLPGWSEAFCIEIRTGLLVGLGVGWGFGVGAGIEWGLLMGLTWMMLNATTISHETKYEQGGHPDLTLSNQEMKRMDRAGLVGTLPKVVWRCPSCGGTAKVPDPRGLPEGKQIKAITCPHCGTRHKPAVSSTEKARRSTATNTHGSPFGSHFQSAQETTAKMFAKFTEQKKEDT